DDDKLPNGPHGGDPRRPLKQVKSECHFSRGMEQVRYLQRHIYNQEEHLRFDSSVGKYQAVTELGQIQAKYWNSQKGFLEQKRAKVDTFCRFNYAIVGILTVQQRVEPKVTVYPTKTQPLEHHNLLACSVSGFYPGHIEIRWFRNGQEEKDGVVSTGLIRNGDWTFQTLVMLEMVPRSGEVYTCQVEHPSLTSPVTVEWKAQSTSAQSKMLSGVGGFVLGLLFLSVGLFIYFRNQEGQSGLQPTVGLGTPELRSSHSAMGSQFHETSEINYPKGVPGSPGLQLVREKHKGNRTGMVVLWDRAGVSRAWGEPSLG
ncbi:MHC class II antigen, partial [Sigmodon hispidus]